MDGNMAAVIGSICGVIITGLQVYQNIVMGRLSKKVDHSVELRQQNANRLDNMATKLDHVHICVEAKSNETTSAIREVKEVVDQIKSS